MSLKYFYFIVSSKLIMQVDFEKISPEQIADNVFQQIGQDWMLITAGKDKNFNFMTASWGGLGILWNKPVCFCFIRPERHTRKFMEENEIFTVSFFPPEYRDELMFCGTSSGRDTDKVAKTGFTPVISQNNAVYFEEARLVVECKKIYYQDIDPKNFLDESIKNNYPQKDYHRMYVGEIINCLIKT